VRSCWNLFAGFRWACLAILLCHCGFSLEQTNPLARIPFRSSTSPPLTRAQKSRRKFFQRDAADYLTNPERIAGYLNEVIATGDPAVIEHALGVAARAIARYQARRKANALMVAEAQALRLP
jgi:hypothetical protein